MSTTETTIVNKTETAKLPDFGNGAYSKWMVSIYKDAMRVFKLESEQAEKFARQAATEIGAIRAQGGVEVWFSKVNKDGKTTVYDVSKVKGVIMTNTMMALKAIGFANEAGKNGFSCGKTQWVVMPESPLEAYLLEL